jgi:hypothetical protein
VPGEEGDRFRSRYGDIVEGPDAGDIEHVPVDHTSIIGSATRRQVAAKAATSSITTNR